MSHLLLAALAVFLINAPFGYWRAGTRKFSPAWFVAVHAPVPLVVAIRLLSGLGFQPYTYVAMVAAYFTGQFLGGRAHAWRANGRDRTGGSA